MRNKDILATGALVINLAVLAGVTKDTQIDIPREKQLLFDSIHRECPSETLETIQAFSDIGFSELRYLSVLDPHTIEKRALCAVLYDKGKIEKGLSPESFRGGKDIFLGIAALFGTAISATSLISSFRTYRRRQRRIVRPSEKVEY
jgi:hypothetical protein